MFSPQTFNAVYTIFKSSFRFKCYNQDISQNQLNKKKKTDFSNFKILYSEKSDLRKNR